jgi:hypothetical protein
MDDPRSSRDAGCARSGRLLGIIAVPGLSLPDVRDFTSPGALGMCMYARYV